MPSPVVTDSGGRCEHPLVDPKRRGDVCSEGGPHTPWPGPTDTPPGGSSDSNRGNTGDSKAKTALDMFMPENFSRTFQRIKNKGQERGKGIGSISLL